ncbi:hypothetical protein QLX52_03355 [Streptomyces albus]|uniref:hypothetical protein n=1 Tax=Streptomyces albus TaxID=1888 RepID=UPI0024ACC85B|nr:hypothetical protein [Streptomyces albus]MDI6407884.1 hypothetical protein [Streptomyces albus]
MFEHVTSPRARFEEPTGAGPYAAPAVVGRTRTAAEHRTGPAPRRRRTTLRASTLAAALSPAASHRIPHRRAGRAGTPGRQRTARTGIPGLPPAAAPAALVQLTGH